MNRRDALGFSAVGLVALPCGARAARLPTGLPGCFWYQRSGDLYRVRNGIGRPQRVNSIKCRSRSDPSFRVSTNGRHYLQISNHGDGNRSACMLLYFDAVTHEQRGFVDMNGYVVDARVSPSGKYIAMVRSPDYMNTLNLSTSKNIAGLTVVDIGDSKNPRAIRSTFDRDAAATIQFAWYGDDRYVYMTLNGGLYGGTAAGGQDGERRLGRFASSSLIKGEFSLHPGGDSFLMKGRRGPDDYDVYLCGTDGRIQRQMTAVGMGYAPQWSPDGSMFMFKRGTAGLRCVGSDCSICEGPYCAPSSASNVIRENAARLETLSAACQQDIFWTADPEA
jgi:hypothetical protein